MKFASRVSRNKTIFSPSGEKVVPEYGMKVDKKTSEKYVGVIGKVDIYSPIQEALAGVYLKTNLERFNVGAMSLDEYKEFLDLSKKAAPFADFTSLPSTLAEVQQILIDADKTFYGLPVELRADFGHSKERFLAAMADGSASNVFQRFSDRKGLKTSVSVKESSKEEKKDES